MTITGQVETLGVKQHTHRLDLDSITADEALTGVPGSIAPDDTAAEGSASSLARSDHRHGFTAATAAALTKTATAGEGSANTSARSDHVHATSALPWGIVARITIAVDSAGYTADATTDYVLNSVVVDAARLYKVCFEGPFTISAAARWDFDFHVGGVNTARLFLHTAAANATQWASGAALWEPSSGTVNVDMRLDEISGTATLTIHSGRFWIEDIGPR